MQKITKLFEKLEKTSKTLLEEFILFITCENCSWPQICSHVSIGNHWLGWAEMDLRHLMGAIITVTRYLGNAPEVTSTKMCGKHFVHEMGVK